MRGVGFSMVLNMTSQASGFRVEGASPGKRGCVRESERERRREREREGERERERPWSKSRIQTPSGYGALGSERESGKEGGRERESDT